MASHLSFLVIGEGTDAPGIRLVPDGKGGWKIEKVPGWNPEQMAELGSALKAVEAGGRLKNATASKAILDHAAGLAQTELSGVLGKQAAAADVVVVFAR
jgi:hypothetical protein